MWNQNPNYCASWELTEKCRLHIDYVNKAYDNIPVGREREVQFEIPDNDASGTTNISESRSNFSSDNVDVQMVVPGRVMSLTDVSEFL